MRKIPNQRCVSPKSARAGLAPLELVLVLPVLLFLMALMINFGAVSGWKVRTQVNARYEAWRTLTIRTGASNPFPDMWPGSASLTASTTTALPQVNQLWNSNTDLTCPCVRGPTITAPNSDATITVLRKLDMDDGVHRGNATMSRGYPLLQKAMTQKTYQLQTNVDLLDNPWQFQTLWSGADDPRGLGNMMSRAQLWWGIDLDELQGKDGQFDQSYGKMQQADSQVKSFAGAQNLAPLDQDDEFRQYDPRPCIDGSLACTPDFYPRIRKACSLDPNVVQMNSVQPFLQRVEDLPCSLAGQFMNLYANKITCPAKCTAPNTAYETKLTQLQQFVSALPPNQYTMQKCSTRPPTCPDCPQQ